MRGSPCVGGHPRLRAPVLEDWSFCCLVCAPSGASARGSSSGSHGSARCVSPRGSARNSSLRAGPGPRCPGSLLPSDPSRPFQSPRLSPHVRIRYVCGSVSPFGGRWHLSWAQPLRPWPRWERAVTVRRVCVGPSHLLWDGERPVTEPRFRRRRPAAEGRRSHPPHSASFASNPFVSFPNCSKRTFSDF